MELTQVPLPTGSATMMANSIGKALAELATQTVGEAYRSLKSWQEIDGDDRGVWLASFPSISDGLPKVNLTVPFEVLPRKFS